MSMNRSMLRMVILTILIRQGCSCISTRSRARGSGLVQPGIDTGSGGPLAPLSTGTGPNVAAAGPGPVEAIPIDISPHEQPLGSGVEVVEYDPIGFNTEGGGPVNSGAGLACNLDDRDFPCCWANSVPPDDQLDWKMAVGRPDDEHIAMIFGNIVDVPTGRYLLSSSVNAAPSDEAQLSSCAIACSNGPIVVRLRHWQSENVLLQACQRESFPISADYSPLLNCQEFPPSFSSGPSQITLPKASLIDIVIVASNFVGEQLDLVVIDDIQVEYENDGDECRPIESNHLEKGPDEKWQGSGRTRPVDGRTLVEENTEQIVVEEQLLIEDCQRVKCDFESGTICNYRNSQRQDVFNGVAAGFQVVNGQFMNRVTGIRQGVGFYYLASFLYPRETATIEVFVDYLSDDRSIRFEYFEGTHGLQLRGCCSNEDTCPFSSDFDVSVADRAWKSAYFICPQGTDKILFICENTRTNQGACGLDDITIYKNDNSIPAC